MVVGAGTWSQQPLGRLRKEDLKIKVSLKYIVRPPSLDTKISKQPVRGLALPKFIVNPQHESLRSV